ncbi:MAG: hypothetical protein O2993_08075, partial [Bacteroidetes bacterium]|nr:hypothetical protein [Bacteroidota bacterium]
MKKIFSVLILLLMACSGEDGTSGIDGADPATLEVNNEGFNYLVDGYTGSFPTLTLVRGELYYFSYTGTAHPFALRLSDSNTANVPGTTNNDPINGIVNTDTLISYRVPYDAPDSI